jgi:hypothetical protein
MRGGDALNSVQNRQNLLSEIRNSRPLPENVIRIVFHILRTHRKLKIEGCKYSSFIERNHFATSPFFWSESEKIDYLI